jgi:hypothetical protein
VLVIETSLLGHLGRKLTPPKIERANDIEISKEAFDYMHKLDR